MKIDYEGLKKHLESIKYSEIETDWNKPESPSLLKGTSTYDIEYFKMDASKIPSEKLIKYGDPFLVDALGNDLSILILTKRRYKLPTGRVVNAKLNRTIISDCRKLYGTPLNGYWIIPKQFILK